GAELRLVFPYLCLQFFPIELSQNLSLLHMISGIDHELLNNAAGFGFHLDFSDRLNLAGCYHTLGEVALLDAGDLGRIDLGLAAGRLGNGSADRKHHHNGRDDPPYRPLLFPMIAVRHVPSKLARLNGFIRPYPAFGSKCSLAVAECPSEDTNAMHLRPENHPGSKQFPKKINPKIPTGYVQGLAGAVQAPIGIDERSRC